MQEFSIYFNRKDCYEDLGILLKEPIYLPPNNEDVEEISIEGRNGSLTRKKGTFPDRSLDITFVLPHLNKNEMYEKIEEILEWLENIEDNKLIIREDRYYIVKSVSYGDITTQALRFYEITITVTLKPFAYDLWEKEVVLIGTDTIRNKGNVYSEPIITIEPKTAITNFTITINNKDFKIVDTINNTTIINSELSRCISNGLNVNTKGDYPKLNKGNNVIKFDSSKATVKINNITRWR